MYEFVSLNLKCPVCGVSLMNRESLVDNKPSIHLMVHCGDMEGPIYLSSIYGSYNYRCDLEMPQGLVASFYCPHCNNQVTSKSECLSCKAPMVPFFLDMGGKVSICSRVGCKNHFVEFEDLTLAMQKLYEDYGYEDMPVSRPSEAAPQAAEKPANDRKEVIGSGTFLQTYCPHCRKSLIENDMLKLRVERNGEFGELLLSPYLNVFTSKSTIYLPEDHLIEEIMCYHCGHSLIEKDRECAVCRSPVARIEIGAKTRLLDFYICTKKGCRWHGLNDEDMFDIKLDDTMDW